MLKSQNATPVTRALGEWAVNHAAELKLRAERRAGQLLTFAPGRSREILGYAEIVSPTHRNLSGSHPTLGRVVAFGVRGLWRQLIDDLRRAYVGSTHVESRRLLQVFSESDGVRNRSRGVRGVDFLRHGSSNI